MSSGIACMGAVALALSLGCDGASFRAEGAQPVSAVQQGTPGGGAPRAEAVGYDLRRIRPRNEESLEAEFARLFEQARADGKDVAVLFSADWCDACKVLDLELGNLHPQEAIGHTRVLELKEEDWEAVTRMDEFSRLRARWYPDDNVYPVFVVLDGQAAKREEMKEAIARLKALGREPTIANWFADLHASS